MNKYKIRKILVLIATLAMIVGAAFGINHFMSGGKRTLQALDGTPVEMSQVTGAKYAVLVMYWAIDCQYCQKMLANMHRFNSAVRPVPTLNEQFLVVAINVKDSREETAQFLGTYGISVASLIGPMPDVQGLPYTELYIQGQLADRWMGLVEYAQLVEDVWAHMPKEGGTENE